MSKSLPEWLVRLKPLAPFHLGEGPTLTECTLHPRADTIWSALVSLAHSFGKTDLASRMEDGEAFLISSAFPCCGGILFFPKPLAPLAWSKDSLDRRKSMNKVRFVSQKVLNAWKSSGDFPWDKLALDRGNCLLTWSEVEDGKVPDWLITEETLAGNVVDRTICGADTFERTVVRYNHEEGVGLYLRMRCEQSLKEQVSELLKELGSRGLGGDRSIGNGSFYVTESPVKIDSASTTNMATKWVCLSPYHPTTDEVAAGVLENSSYQLLDRSGWIDQSPFQRKRIRMLAEGTILQGFKAKLGGYGDVVDVTPEIASHPVKRYGRAYLWPVE